MAITASATDKRNRQGGLIRVISRTARIHKSFRHRGAPFRPIGQAAGRPISVSRLDPFFAQPVGGGADRPLVDPHLSRQPLRVAVAVGVSILLLAMGLAVWTSRSRTVFAVPHRTIVLRHTLARRNQVPAIAIFFAQTAEWMVAPQRTEAAVDEGGETVTGIGGNMGMGGDSVVGTGRARARPRHPPTWA